MNITPDTLDKAIEFGVPFEVYDNGTKVRNSAQYAPEVIWDAQGDDAEMVRYLRSQGWEPLSGFTGQYGYHGPVMHASEYVGGGLARRVLAEDGVYVVEVVYDMDDSDGEAVGWIIAQRVSHSPSH